MPYNTSTSFPPVGNPVYRIDTNWCMGDSLLYINANFFNLDSRTDALSTNVLSLSSQFKSLSGLSSQTIALRYNNRNDTLSGEVLNNSLGTIKLGGDILQSGRALLTAVSLSALRDINFTTLNNNESLLWNSATNRWENRPIILGAGASIAAGDYGEIKIVTSSNWQVQSSSTTDSLRAITTDHIKDNAITEAKIDSNAVTGTKIASNAVTEAKIASNAVTEAKIASNAVTEAKIASNAVTGTKILSGAVTEAKIDSNAVTGTKIASNAVTEAKILTGAVTPTKLSTGAPVWNTLGDVGIGTTNPSTRLHIYNSDNTTYANTTLTIQASSNQPQTFVNINNIGSNSNGAFLIGQATSNGEYMATANPRDFILRSTNGFLGVTGLSGIKFGGNNNYAETMRITAAGNVGIGTTNPTSTLHIVGAQDLLMTERYGEATGITARRANGTITTPTQVLNDQRFAHFVGGTYGTTGFGSNPAAMNFHAAQNHTDTARGSYITFDTTTINQANRAERMRITDSGNVGIGTTDPQGKLEVNGCTITKTIITNRITVLEENSVFSSLW